MEIEDFKNMIDYIEDHLTEHIDLDDIANFAYFSLPHIHRIFKRLMDYTLKEYIRKRRLSEAAIELINSDLKILELAIKYQYNSNESFTRAFKQNFGVTPLQYRKNNKIVGITPIHKITEEGDNLKLLHEIETIYNQFRDNPAKFNMKRALSQYKYEVIEEVKTNTYSKDTVNFATEVLFRMDEYSEMEHIFTQYLTKSLDVEDEAFARYNLFMIRRKNEGKIKKEFSELFNWMTSNLPKEKWYWIISNGSVMLDLCAANEEQYLLKVIRYIRENAIDCPENRRVRFESSRALAATYQHFNKHEQCIQELRVLETIVNEDQDDLNYYFHKGEYLNRRLSLFNQLGEGTEVNQAIDDMIILMEEWKENLEELSTLFKSNPSNKTCIYSFEEVNENRDPYRAYCTINHNFACMLYNCNQYELALNYFKESIELKTHLNAYSGGLYLGSLWKVTSDKKLLSDEIREQKRLYENDPEYWKRVPVLKDLVDDQNFLERLDK